MSIVRRVSDLVRGNLNEWLTQFERPEVMLNQLMEELRSERDQLRHQVRLCSVDENRLKYQIEDHQEAERLWRQRAQMAVRRDEDELAYEAIEKRQVEEGIIAELTRQWESQHVLVEELKSALQRIDRRFDEAQRTRQRLLDEYRLAEAQRRALSTLGRVSNPESESRFEQVRLKVMNARALAAAEGEMTSLNSRDAFEQLETGGAIEDELLQLKMEAGKRLAGSPDHTIENRSRRALSE